LVQPTGVEDHRWRNRLLSSPLWLVALLPILPPLFFFAYASWEPGCVAADGGTVDTFRIGAAVTVVVQIAALVLLARRMRDHPGLGGLLAIVTTVVLFVVGWTITLAIGGDTGNTSC
jgi:hypothetical protein